MTGEDDVLHPLASNEYAVTAERILNHLGPLTQLSPITWNELLTHLPELTARAVVIRQVDSLNATLELCQSGLGHLAAGFIRQAVEEVIWLEYINTLDHDDANELLRAMGVSDSSRGLIATWKYAGGEQMAAFGFPERFLAFEEAQRQYSVKALKKLGVRLGWPKNQAPPNMRWLAEQVDRLPLYEYLHSASSRFVHFSAGEVFRRGWTDESNTIRFNDEDHRLYLSKLAIAELVPLLLSATAVALELADDENLPDLDGDSFEADIKQFAGLGKVPMVLPTEFNLAPNQQADAFKS